MISCNKTKFRLGELFCGPGGIGVGASLARVVAGDCEYLIDHVRATDYHPDTCATYRRNIFPKSPERVVCSDIRTLDLNRLKEISEIDALAFGFPCNDFSQVGEQKGIEGEYGPLYTYAAKVLHFFKPKWFLAENVGGLSSSNEGKAFVSILNEFKECGYTLYPHLYKFEGYGVPQARHRIIIIGIHKDVKLNFKIPAPTGVRRTVRDALKDIPSDAPNQEITKQSAIVVERLRHIKPGENAFNADIPAHLQLNIKGARISQIYKRLDPDKPAYTVTGSGGGGTHIYHWKEPRALTNREITMLQTFDDLTKVA
jgi:DNA (cytosine-5)-methyltransferase 1